MRVVVVGASGDVGTALLRRLAGDETINSVVAVARRTPPPRPAPPYEVAEWVSCDIGAQGPTRRVVETLTRVFAGADAVVHLAWAVQPSHDRDRLHRTNVADTRRVVAAVGAAGIPSSSYSTDKVRVERELDDAERRHPHLVVARVRPALVFQHDAGREITRYFLGPWMPGAVFAGRLPVLPWPRGLRLQAVHADDLADAYREVVVRRLTGAVNIAGPGTIHAQDVADLLSLGRWREVPVPAVRARSRQAGAPTSCRSAPGGSTWRCRPRCSTPPGRTGTSTCAPGAAGRRPWPTCSTGWLPVRAPPTHRCARPRAAAVRTNTTPHRWRTDEHR